MYTYAPDSARAIEAMKPSPFEHLWAQDVDHVVRALVEHGGDARIIAGGQSLVPMLALRMARPELLVDINRAAGLGSYALDDGVLSVEAAVTARTLERDRPLMERFPMLAEALRWIAHPEIRNRTTVCGSLAHADPAAELPALALALDATLHAVSVEGRRAVPASDFFVGPYMTALEEGEFLASIDLPVPRHEDGWAVGEIARRRGDFALVGAAGLLRLHDDGRTCQQARLALFGVAGRPVRAHLLEEQLVGVELDPGVLAEASQASFDGVEVFGDIHGSATYRQRAGRVLVARTLVSAFNRIPARPASKDGRNP